MRRPTFLDGEASEVQGQATTVPAASLGMREFNLDYETRRVYASLKSDYYSSSDFSHRIDTVQTWYCSLRSRLLDTGDLVCSTSTPIHGENSRRHGVAFLLRLFKRGAWIEAGPTTDGKVQAMFMFNF